MYRHLDRPFNRKVAKTLSPGVLYCLFREMAIAFRQTPTESRAA